MSYKEIYQRSIEDREGFWREQAKELTWYLFPQTILSKTDEDLYQWFEDGKLNMSYLCLDYHIEQGRGEQVAIIYDSPATGQVQKFTYNEVKTQVAKLAGVLKSLQVLKGDTVVIYMPMITEFNIINLYYYYC